MWQKEGGILSGERNYKSVTCSLPVFLEWWYIQTLPLTSYNLSSMVPGCQFLSMSVMTRSARRVSISKHECLDTKIGDVYSIQCDGASFSRNHSSMTVVMHIVYIDQVWIYSPRDYSLGYEYSYLHLTEKLTSFFCYWSVWLSDG